MQVRHDLLNGKGLPVGDDDSHLLLLLPSFAAAAGGSGGGCGAFAVAFVMMVAALTIPCDERDRCILARPNQIRASHSMIPMIPNMFFWGVRRMGI